MERGSSNTMISSVILIPLHWKLQTYIMSKAKMSINQNSLLLRQPRRISQQQGTRLRLMLALMMELPRTCNRTQNPKPWLLQFLHHLKIGLVNSKHGKFQFRIRMVILRRAMLPSVMNGRSAGTNLFGHIVGQGTVCSVHPTLMIVQFHCIG